jgi:hypothetical protein
MRTTRVHRAVLVFAVTLFLAGHVLAQSSAPTKLEGVINDYTDATSASGPWHLVGEWSVRVKGSSGKADFAVSLTMVRSANGGSPHTHHIGLHDAEVTLLPNGYRLTGPGVMTSNGATAGFTGSEVVIDIVGNTAVPLANVKILFGGAAVGHFGDQPLDGVVTVRP